MRIVLFFVISIISTCAFSQNPVYYDIQAFKADYPFYTLKSLTKSSENKEEIKGLSDYQRFNFQFVDSDGMSDAKIVKLNVSLGLDNFDLQLIASEILQPDFKVVNAFNQIVPVQLGKFYWGIVNEDPNSLAAISVFDDEIIGVFSTPSQGNYILGRLEGNTENDHVLFAERDISVPNTYECHVEDEESEVPNWTSAAFTAIDKCKNVGVYFEADNQLYIDRQRNMTNVTNFVTGLFNVVALLYDNEDVNTDISELKIWNTPDPYRKNTSLNCLNDFKSGVGNNFNGDLAHLLTTSRNNIGGRAYINVLCNSVNRAAISNINGNYRLFPSYSWTVEVVTHEMGHNLGSRHTHSCSWGPFRNQALDNCRETEGSCLPGPAPVGGGTIMSYCHLTSFGINLTKGFGEEPGDLIRDRVNSAVCLGGAFEAKASNQDEDQFYLGDSTTLKASPLGPAYDYQWYRNGSEIVGATGSSLKVKESGTYVCHVTTSCYEETNEIEIDVIDFLVSLKCPPTSGGFEFVEILIDSFFVDVDEIEEVINIPPSFYQSVHNNALTRELEFEYCVGDLGGSQLRHLSIFYTGPAGSGIVGGELTDYKALVKGHKCYDIVLGDFDPTGLWTFRFQDENDDNDNEPESYAFFTFKQKWSYGPQPGDCSTFICQNGTITLDAGYPNLTYKWTTGETTQVITVSSPGTYGVTVNNGPIERSDDIEVILAPQSFNKDSTVCYGERVRFGNRLLGDSGEYIDSFMATYGCDSIVNLNLTVKPKNDIIVDTFLCYLDTFNGIAYNTSVSKSDIYIGRDGCDSFFTESITVNPEITLQFGVQRGCEDQGGVITATATGGSGGAFEYKWSTGFTGAILTGAKSGLNICTVTDEKGCSFVKPVSIGNFDSVGVSIEKVDVSCFGKATGSAEASITSGRKPFEYVWSSGEMVNSIDMLESGDYTLVVTDRNDCSEEMVVTIDENEEIQANEDVSPAGSANKGSIVLNPSGGVSPYEYTWIDGPTTKDRVNLKAGFYSVLIYDALNCSNLIEIEVKMRTSIQDLNDVEKYAMYPNPTDQLLVVELKLSQSQKIKLYVLNLEGKILLEQEFESKKDQNFRLDVGGFANGLYILQIVVDSQVGLDMFVKE